MPLFFYKPYNDTKKITLKNIFLDFIEIYTHYK